MIICLDSSCIISLVENDPNWGLKVASRIAVLRNAGAAIATSDLSRSECLVGPLMSGDAGLLANYQTFFASPTIQILPLTSEVCEKAAELRAASNATLKLPDCLHLAAAIKSGCSIFITHDVRLAKCLAINVEVIS